MERAIPWGVFAILMTIASWWRPRPMRGVVGVFFALMGLGVHGAFVATNPDSYLGFAQQALIPGYARLAQAVVLAVTPVVFGIAMVLFEVTLAVLILGRGRRATVALVVGALFLVAITPLGVEVLPNAILAVGLLRLARESYPATARSEFRAWRVARRSGPHLSGGGLGG